MSPYAPESSEKWKKKAKHLSLYTYCASFEENTNGFCSVAIAGFTKRRGNGSWTYTNTLKHNKREPMNLTYYIKEIKYEA